MAKLSAHGSELGRLAFTTYSLAYMSDGKILKNGGNGWKLYKKCAPGVTPERAFASAQARRAEFADAHPCLMAYRKELHSIAGMGKAWKLHTAIELLGNDVDGIWSEACDGYGDNVHADVEEIAGLVRLYNAAQDESAELRDPTNAISA